MKLPIDTFKDKLGNEIFRIYISTSQPMKRQKRLHRHTEFELSLILSGSGIYNTKSGDYHFRQGDIFLFSSNEYHCITDVFEYGEQKALQLLNIQFAPAFIYAADNFNATSFMNVFINRTEQFRNMLTRDNPCTASIRQTFYHVKQECEEKKPCYHTEVQNSIISILINIFRNYNYANFTIDSAPNHADIHNLQKAVAFINENFCEDISLDDIAQAAYISKYHFARLFRSVYNMTVWNYITIQRIDKAIHLLSSSNENITNIAMKSGFNSVTNFNRTFKKVTGCIPKEYRQNRSSTQTN